MQPRVSRWFLAGCVCRLDPYTSEKARSSKAECGRQLVATCAWFLFGAFERARSVARIAFAITIFGVSAAYADSIRIIELEYDDAGNLIGTTSRVITEPPIIASLTPRAINIGQTQAFTALGSNLVEMAIVTSNPGLEITGVSVTDTEIQFNLVANSNAVEGNTTVTFFNPLGSDSEIITVAGALPTVTTSPSPMVVAPDAEPNNFRLVLAETRGADLSITLAVTDDTIATVTPNIVNVLAGETSAEFAITGLVVGNAALEISPTDVDTTTSLPVFVAEPFSGDGSENSKPVGVIVGSDNPYAPDSPTTFGSRVGVVLGGTFNRLHTAPVGVTVGGDILPVPPVGVLVGQPTLIVGGPYGAIVGPLLLGSTPTTVAPGESVTLRITGANLQSVDSVAIEPPGNIILGPSTINSEGTGISVSMDVEAGAILGSRRIVVSTPNGDIEPRDIPTLEFNVE